MSLIEVPQCSCGKEWTTIHALTCLGSPTGTMFVEDDEMPDATPTLEQVRKLQETIADAEKQLSGTIGGLVKEFQPLGWKLIKQSDFDEIVKKRQNLEDQVRDLTAKLNSQPSTRGRRTVTTTTAKDKLVDPNTGKLLSQEQKQSIRRFKGLPAAGRNAKITAEDAHEWFSAGSPKGHAEPAVVS